MANQTQEQSGGDGAQQQDFLKEADAIIAACHAIGAEHAEMMQRLAEAQTAKDGHRQAYEQGLDRGDEAAMKKSLAGIRQVNSDIEALQKRLSALPQKTDGLLSRHAVLCDKVRDLRPKAQAALDQARRDFEQAEHVLQQCSQGVQSELNSVTDAIQAASL